MIIRSAIATDVPEIMRIRMSVKENHLDRAGMAKYGITDESLAEMLAGDVPGWCATEGDSMLGFVMADRNKAKIFALFVDPNAEGKGAGTALLNTAVSFLYEMGHARLVLSTESGSRAHGFYKARGWLETGIDEDGEMGFELFRDKDN